MTELQVWWLALALEAVVAVVVAVLLGLIVAAAKSIDHHAAQIWTVGKQIAGNTVALWILGDIKERLDKAERAVGSLRQAAGSLNDSLRSLAK